MALTALKEPLPNQECCFTSLSDLCDYRAAHQPNKDAFVFLKDGETISGGLTYSSLRQQAMQLAHHLTAQNLQAQRALLLYPSGLDFVIAFWACLYAGVVAVPVYTPKNRDEQWARLDAIRNNCQATVILSTAKQYESCQSFISASSGLANCMLILTDQVSDQSTPCILPKFTRQDIAFLQYTSGSTGSPKGVVVTHGNLLHNQMLMHTGFGNSSDSIFVSWLPLFHDMGLIGNVLHSVYLGSTCYLMSPVAFIQKPVRWLQAISRFRGTSSFAPNFAYELCIAKTTPQERAELDLSCWQFALNGAEPVSAQTLENFCQCFADAGFPATAFYPGYGLAEATLFVAGGGRATAAKVTDFDAASLKQGRAKLSSNASAQRMVSCGQVWCDEQLLIVNEQTGAPLAYGEIGEIWLASPSIAEGYWENPSATSEVFHAKTLQNSEQQYLRTGDLGFVWHNELYIAGRLKEMIIIRGRNHYPQDIEHTVQQTSADLRPGCGSAFSSNVGGHEKLIVVQEVQRTALKHFEPTELLQQVKQQINLHHEVELYELVLIKPGTLPKTSSGKIQRRTAKQLYETGQLDSIIAPAIRVAPPQQKSAAPLDFKLVGIANTLCAMIASLSPDQASIPAATDSPASLGLDSLKCVELQHLIHQTYQVSTNIEQLYAAESFFALAALVSGGVPNQHHTASTGTFPTAIAQTSGATKLPTTANQQSLLYIQQLQPDNSAYNIVLPLQLDFEVNTELMSDSVQVLLKRHAILSAKLRDDSISEQWIEYPAAVPFFQLNLPADADITTFVRNRSSQPLAQSAQPTFRVELIRTGNNANILLLMAHHAFSDLTSILHCAQELLTLYAAKLQDRTADLPSLVRQFADVVAAQQAYLQSPQAEIDQKFWQTSLAQAEPLVTLPYQPTTGIHSGKQAASVDFIIEEDLTTQVKSFAKQHRYTEFHVLFACFAILLQRFSGQYNVVIGTPFAERGHADLHDVVGYLVNTLPVPVQIKPDDTMLNLIDKVRGTVFQAVQHGKYPFAKIIQDLYLPREQIHNPLVQCLFNFHANTSHEQLMPLLQGQQPAEVQIAGLTVSPVKLLPSDVQFELTLSVVPVAANYQLRFDYAAAQLDESVIDSMALAYQQIIRQLCTEPDKLIGNFPVTTAEYRHQASQLWNNTGVQYPDRNCICTSILRSMQAYPDQIALVQGKHKVTYSELSKQVAALVQQLQQQGVTTDTVVAVKLSRSCHQVVSLLAVLFSGATYLPLDPEAPTERLSRMLEIAQPKLLLSDRHEVLNINQLCVTADVLAADAPPLSAQVPPAQSAAYVIFTSGSTGEPKAVLNNHLALENRLNWMQSVFELQQNDRVLLKTPYTFDVSVWEFFWPLMQGAGLVICTHDGHKDPDYLAALISDTAVTLCHFVPSMLEVFLQALQHPLPQLRAVVCSGEELPPLTVNTFYQQLPQARLVNLYGPTEAAIDVSIYSCLQSTQLARVPIGRPIANIQLYVLDDQYHIQPVGVPGELYIGGIGLARGYVSRPALTAERFIPDMAGSDPGSRLYRTGDRARYLADGNIEYMGRLDHQIKLRGQRIETGEIESIALQSGLVKAAVVLIHMDNLVLVVTPTTETNPTLTKELQTYLQRFLPPYMVPQQIVLCSQFPVNNNGKMDRKALLTAISTECETQPEVSNQHINTATEAGLAFLCQKLFNGRQPLLDSHFFAQGGHSLLAAQLAQQLRQFFKVPVSVNDVIGTATLRQLAKKIDGSASLEHESPKAYHNHSTKLSIQQHSLWLNRQILDNSRLYLLPVILSVQNCLESAPIIERVTKVLNSHSELTCCYTQQNFEPVRTTQGNPIQITLEQLPSAANSHQLQARLSHFLQQAEQEDRNVFARAIYTQDTTLILCLVFNHLAVDALSLEHIVRQISELSEIIPADSQMMRYSGYCEWQHTMLANNKWDQQARFWQQELQALPLLHNVQTDYLRPARHSGRGAIVSLTLPENICSLLRQMAQQHHVSLFVLLTSAFQILLHKYSTSEDIIIGMPVNCRPDDFSHDVVGLCVNTLPLRQAIEPQKNLTELIKLTQHKFEQLNNNRDLPFEKIIELLNLPTAKSHAPIYQIVIAMQPDLASQLENLPQWSFELMHTATAKYDLNLMVVPKNTELTLYLEYNTELFSEATCQHMLSQYGFLLEQYCHNENATVGSLRLTNANIPAMLVPPVLSNSEDNLCQRFSQVLRTLPAHQVAVDHENNQLNYLQLDELSQRIALNLLNSGIQPGSRIGLYSERSPELIVAILAILKAGCAYVPLDPDYPLERLQYICHDACLSAILIHAHTAPDWLPDNILRCHYSDLLVACAQHKVLPLILPHDSAYMIYTSGSTGNPKGVEVSHHNVCRLFDSCRDIYEFNQNDVWTLFHSYAFDFSVWEIWGALLYGGQLVVVPYWTSRSPADFVTLLQTKRVTVLNQTPSAFAQVSQTALSTDQQLTSLRYIIFGGEALAFSSLRDWYTNYPTQPVLVNMYGITETTVHVTSHIISEQDIEANLSVIGQPLKDLAVYLLDGCGKLQAIGVPGEMFIAGPGVSKGYFNKPELTSSRFLPDPFAASPDQRMYRSGDKARQLADGRIQYLGRIDKQVQIRGFRIEVGEVEAALRDLLQLEQVVVRPSSNYEFLIAYLIDSGFEQANAAHFNQSLATRLPDYMLPARYIMTDHLPLTSNGKLDELALAKLAMVATTTAAPALTATEQKLASLWCQVLAVTEINPALSFFACGGNSLAAIRLLKEISEAFNQQLHIRDIFTHPSLTEMALLLDTQLQDSKAITIKARPAKAPAYASPAQQRLCFLEQLSDVGNLYAMPVEFRINGNLNVARFEAAVNQLIQRHPVLRHRFQQDADELCHDRIAERKWLIIDDFTDVPLQTLPQAIEDTITENQQHRFNLFTDQLFVIRLILCGPEHSYLMLNFHHAIFDGWSFDIFATELSALYNGTTLPALPPSDFIDFAYWQHQQKSVDHTGRAYWQKTLKNAPQSHALRTDFIRPGLPSYQGELVPQELPETLTTQLKTFCQAYGLTSYQVTFAAFCILIMRYSHENDVVIGIPAANRQLAECQNMIGFLTNTLPIRLQSDGMISVLQFIEIIKQQTLEALSHQDVPFESIVEAAGSQRMLNQAPVFQLLFSMQQSDYRKLALRDLRFEFQMPLNRKSKFDLSLYLEDTNSLKCTFEFARDLFKRSSIERMAKHYVHFLTSICTSPHKLLCNLQLTSAEEQQQLSHAAALTKLPPQALHQQFWLNAQTSPQHVAIQTVAASFNYAEVANRTATLIAQLQAHNVTIGARIGICLERDEWLICSMLAILTINAVYVPLDPKYPQERLSVIIEDSTPDLILCSNNTSTIVQQLTTTAGQYLNISALPQTAQPWPKQTSVPPESLAYLIYTSGSTGRPKGVAISHRSACALVQWAVAQFSSAELAQVLASTSMCFDLSVFEIFTPLSLGGSLILVDNAMQLAEHRYLQPTLLNTVPSVAEALCTSDLLPSSLLTINLAGEVLSSQLVKQLQVKLTHCKIYNLYGPSEDTTYSTVELVTTATHDEPAIGMPLPGTTAYVLDPHFNLMPTGIPGELFLSGIGLSQGYFNQPALTAERFLPNPYASSPGQIFYKTGDQVLRDEDGTLHYIGRLDHQVKLRGHRIELGEIQAQLLKIAAVQSAIALIRHTDHGNTMLAAVVAEGITTAEVQEALKRVLPQYMVPDQILILTSMPLTPNGKVDRQQLLHLAEQVVITPTAGAKLQSGTEQLVAHIWAEVLQQPVQDRNANFFALGGHSLLTGKVLTRLMQQLNINLTLQTLFEHPVLHELANRIDVQLHLVAIAGKPATQTAAATEIFEEGEL